MTAWAAVSARDRRAIVRRGAGQGEASTAVDRRGYLGAAAPQKATAPHDAILLHAVAAGLPLLEGVKREIALVGVQKLGKLLLGESVGKQNTGGLHHERQEKRRFEVQQLHHRPDPQPENHRASAFLAALRLTGSTWEKLNRWDSFL